MKSKSDLGYVATVSKYRAQNCTGCPLRCLCYKGNAARSGALPTKNEADPFLVDLVFYILGEVLYSPLLQHCSCDFHEACDVCTLDIVNAAVRTCPEFDALLMN